MIHINRYDYEMLADFAKQLESGYYDWEIQTEGDITLCAELNLVTDTVEETTGVSFMGQMETYYVPKIKSCEVLCFEAYDRDGNELATDFSEKEFDKYLN